MLNSHLYVLYITKTVAVMNLPALLFYVQWSEA